MNHEELSQRVLAILAGACGDARVLTQPELDLYEEELLDSLAYVQLLAGLEEELNLELWPTQLTREDTRTPSRLVTLVEGKLAQR